MKVLLLGHNGQLGKIIKNKLQKKIKIYIDSKYNKKIIEKNNFINLYNEIKPDIILNSIAYTQVDNAENNNEAFKINSNFIKKIGKIITEETLFIHFSTDYVFDGLKNNPYLITDYPKPLNNYGQSKLEGEKYIQNLMNNYIIIRTSALFSSLGNNFVKKMCELINNNKEINVVNDQYFVPTPCEDLANIIYKILLNYSKKNIYKDLYHFVGSGSSLSWYEFAILINKILGSKNKISSISSYELNLPAKRPKYSVLSDKLIREKYSFEEQSWENFLNHAIKEIKS
tara:strand:+ start:4026 stop:4880 length:855 start_codon:yes stop_codon:yes gene_type:complete